MGFCGYKCPTTGKGVKLADCLKCQAPCMELPMLVAMWGNGPRGRRDERYSVTSMTRPAKAIVLELINDYWTDPFSMVKMTAGSMFHAIMERAGKQLGDDYEMERKFEAVIEVDGRPATLVGVSDQYQRSTRTLTDYKATGTYAFEKARGGDYSGYDIQLNLYRRHQYPEAERLQLAFWLTDYGPRQRDKGYRPFERVDVPILPDGALDGLVRDKIRAIRSGLDDPNLMPPCTDEERWWNGKTYNRCSGYCGAAPFCDQRLAEAKK